MSSLGLERLGVQVDLVLSSHADNLLNSSGLVPKSEMVIYGLQRSAGGIYAPLVFITMIVSSCQTDDCCVRIVYRCSRPIA